MRLLGPTNFSATIRIKNTNNLMTIIFLKLGYKLFFYNQNSYDSRYEFS